MQYLTSSLRTLAAIGCGPRPQPINLRMHNFSISRCEFYYLVTKSLARNVIVFVVCAMHVNYKSKEVPKVAVCVFLCLFGVYLIINSHICHLLEHTDPSKRTDARVYYQAAQIRSLRKQLYAEICTNASRISRSGAWCLFPTDVPMDGASYNLTHNHAATDTGIASTIQSIVKPNQLLLDLGCGIGQYGHYYKQSGAKFAWRGYDGAINVDEYTEGFVKWVDLSVPGFTPDDNRTADWVMALEVGEHVPAPSMNDLIDNIARNARCGVIVSWAVPGQDGHAHVNLLPNERVIDEFSLRGYAYDRDASDLGRQAAIYWWFKNSFMVFIKRDRPETC